jgi:hypothetical protein
MSLARLIAVDWERVEVEAAGPETLRLFVTGKRGGPLAAFDVGRRELRQFARDVLDHTEERPGDPVRRGGV